LPTSFHSELHNKPQSIFCLQLSSITAENTIIYCYLSKIIESYQAASFKSTNGENEVFFRATSPSTRREISLESDDYSTFAPKRC